MRIIKDGRIVEDCWRHLDDDEPLETGPVTVSIDRWRREREELRGREEPVGIRLAAADPTDELIADLEWVPLIVVEFASLRDGRSFSQARILRERYRYGGEIRARGNYIRDQMFFLSRVGVNAFELSDDQRPDDALKALAGFSAVYQPAAGDAARATSAIGHRVRPRY